VTHVVEPPALALIVGCLVLCGGYLRGNFGYVDGFKEGTRVVGATQRWFRSDFRGYGNVSMNPEPLGLCQPPTLIRLQVPPASTQLHAALLTNSEQLLLENKNPRIPCYLSYIVDETQNAYQTEKNYGITGHIRQVISRLRNKANKT